MLPGWRSGWLDRWRAVFRFRRLRDMLPLIHNPAHEDSPVRLDPAGSAVEPIQVALGGMVCEFYLDGPPFGAEAQDGTGRRLRRSEQLEEALFAQMRQVPLRQRGQRPRGQEPPAPVPAVRHPLGAKGAVGRADQDEAELGVV